MTRKPPPRKKPKAAVRQKPLVKKSVDLNCDMGEGSGNDVAIFPYISSVNIACGYHAGDEATIWETIQLAKKHRVAIGAHPSYLDREHFGRKEMNLPVAEIYEIVTQQLLLFQDIADAASCPTHHIKPHGALYNQSAKDKKIARAIAHAVKDFNDRLILFGLSGSHSISEGKALGLETASEVFADRRYRKNGSLVTRAHTQALIEDREEAIQQALQMVLKRKVKSASGAEIAIRADTICLHGDGKHAVEFAKRIKQALKKNNIVLQAF